MTRISADRATEEIQWGLLHLHPRRRLPLRTLSSFRIFYLLSPLRLSNSSN
ncbi:Bifunctional inhibitor/lipid-transfer protein/seed storage 2S albumin superfamily protein [Arabidopsis thaliana]|uniref:At1g05450 n=1 Tax=Arabidopsis thaliana TaxID=3702 RepID=Q8LBJ6_ARATH|nr:Bifunctional inhibitor/lipid-transfer protein/seed storage 2S albumin superfamily protein [Arabidopsis thaliana]AAM64727.1 lipid-transfer protein, putative [Arabidopsis thaliana]ABG25089.1 At1g05450 [Arabidopsis thaliana]AEE27842.1 Bifunctional inhibitor/lipid-transfer protein/seed storage 2S albumin superfamily protein [Arabidopsis thaliana]|eukprot:NP_563740.1 Bifunctional inhibitor/lipid-transfer protein/seed storage 2S albumin superfamily protein [Arabidopsis thaliana]